MKHTLDKVAKHVTENETIAACLFLFIFITRIFLDLIIEKLFGLGEEWQHHIFAFYKYNYVIILGYMFVYEILYLYRFHDYSGQREPACPVLRATQSGRRAIA